MLLEIRANLLFQTTPINYDLVPSRCRKSNQARQVRMPPSPHDENSPDVPPASLVSKNSPNHCLLADFGARLHSMVFVEPHKAVWHAWRGRAPPESLWHPYRRSPPVYRRACLDQDFDKT